MEDEVCQYHKFGYCKYHDGCKRKHFSEKCHELGEYTNKKSCYKRQPRSCKRYASENCQFNNSCAYKHLKPQISIAQDQTNDKIKILEMSVQELTLKVLGLETGLKKVKKKLLRSDEKGVGKENKRNNYISQETPDVNLKEVTNKIEERKKV